MDEEKKKICIEEVKNGGSYYGVAKKYGLQVGDVRNVCIKAGVKSTHPRGFQKKEVK